MSPAARIAAAIEILTDIDLRRRPAAESLRDWGRFNRYAGSRDRAAIAAHVYDALRVKSSACWVMDAQTPRANMIGALRQAREFSLDRTAHLFNGEKHAPAALSDDERSRYAEADLRDAPLDAAADFPTWLTEQLQRALGEGALEEGRALARRAPLDIRVNLLKTSRENALAQLGHFSPFATPISPVGLRIPMTEDGRAPPLTADPVFLKGLIEVQDEGSQIAALLTGACEGEQVLDLCAGAGGKTLALAAMMNNRGQIYATDKDARRLVPIYARLERAGARNVQLRTPRGTNQILSDLKDRCDLVVVDAPCTGIGAWRRNPDSKWRVRPGALEQRMKDQDETLDRAALYVRPGGRVAYITCSLLCEENDDRIAAFLGRHSNFKPMDMREQARKVGLVDFSAREGEGGLGLLLTPATTGTDGFYVCLLVRD